MIVGETPALRLLKTPRQRHLAHSVKLILHNSEEDRVFFMYNIHINRLARIREIVLLKKKNKKVAEADFR